MRTVIEEREQRKKAEGIIEGLLNVGLDDKVIIENIEKILSLSRKEAEKMLNDYKERQMSGVA